MTELSKQPISVDVAVIGAGTAGLAATRAVVEAGKSVVMIEAGAYGTTCARVGCMPSKLLIAAAETAHHARHAAPFGVLTTVKVDGEAVMARVRNERDRFVGFVLDSVDKIPAAHKLVGHARFVSPGRLQVGDQTVIAAAVVVATGSSPYVPTVFDGLGDRLIVNDDVFSWKTLPTSVAVFGLGVIGLELGQALVRLGVRVRMFGRNGGVGPLTDPVVKASALANFREEAYVDPDAIVRKMTLVHGDQTGEKAVRVDFVDSSDVTALEQSETFEYVLVAAGRRPNVRDLGLEHAGIRLDAAAMPLFDRHTLLCESREAGLPGVFVAGDVNDDVPLLHEAADEGAIAGANAARFPAVIPGARRSLLAVTFSEPQLAMVGASFASLTGTDFVIGEVKFAEQGRSRVMMQNRGIGHVYADRATGRLLGAELAGPRVEHLGHLLAWAHQQQMTIAQMLAMPFYHPVVEEGLRTALRDAAAQIAHSPRVT